MFTTFARSSPGQLRNLGSLCRAGRISPMLDPKFQLNPFTVQTPEDLGAHEAIELFVDVFTDFAKVRDIGHCMVNGPRGCGKSMMFRYLLPDCQSLIHSCSLGDLPFVAVLASIKNTDLNLTELQRLIDRHANVVLNEHFLTTYIASRVFHTLSKLAIEPQKVHLEAIRRFFEEVFLARLRLNGWSGKSPRIRISRSVNSYLDAMGKLCDDLYGEVISYVKRLSFSREIERYGGALCGYLDFLYPLLEEMRRLPFMPRSPIYLLIDDADYLNLVQTKILNSWISTRTSASVSIKVSTQLRYKTYVTISKTAIASPHDYHEINVTDLYTTSRSKYLPRVREIVRKRLHLAGIQADPEEFFPPDEEQEREILEIREEIRKNWEVSPRGYRASDDVLRYARPTYIARLRGTRKSGSKYSYSGFEQLVHISSGLIRYFLEPAAIMFSEQQSKSSVGFITKIDPGIQDNIIRSIANNLMLGEFEKIFKEEETEQEGGSHLRDKLLKRKHDLHNLIRVLGGVFLQKLVSSDSERRVFSIAFSDTPDPEISSILTLGIQYGYLHRSTIGNKDGTGRTPLYILTRRLAPYFGLDPTSFAGYLFVKNDKIKEAIAEPDSFLRRVRDHGAEAYFEERQLQLFE
jgi:hypothetical protein